MRLVPSVVLLAAVALSLAGCGSRGEDPSGRALAPSTSPGPGKAAPASAVEGPFSEYSITGRSGEEYESSDEAYGMGEADAEVPATTAAHAAPTSSRAERKVEPAPSPREVARRNRRDMARDLGPEPRRGLDPGIQSGTLTAGSFDDHDRFDAYQEFLSEAMQEDAAETLPRVAIGRRVMIRVMGAGGRPVGDARVVVRPADSRQQGEPGQGPTTPAVLDLATGSDGRVLLLTGTDAPGHGGRFRVTVHASDGSPPVVQTLQVDRQPWEITLPEAQPQLPKRLDLALVIDTTGSMSDELEYLKVEIDSIAKAVYQQFPNVDQRYALVLHRDQGDAYVTRTFDFTASLSEFCSVLAEQSANGGGDYPEAMHVALDNAAKLDWRDRDTARVLFLVGDAPPHDQFAGRTLDAIGTLRTRGVRIFPVASSGVATKAEFVMRAGAFLTLGQYLFLTDHSGVGNPHARPHVPDYEVERLDRLMIRMIASELAGRRLSADEVIAVEHGDGSVPQPDEGPVPPEQRQTPGLSGAAGKPWGFPKIPGWAILAAAILGLCVADSVVDRRRPD